MHASRATTRKPFCRGKRAVSSVVVCAGDSLTHASLSADYVSRLRQRLSSHAYEIVNAGLNGNESTDLLRRIPDIVRCKPDAVSVLIGSNDVRTRFPQEAEPAFQTNLNAIVGELRKKTEARIALLSIYRPWERTSQGKPIGTWIAATP
jgi:acyl-CoA thioesterase I